MTSWKDYDALVEHYKAIGTKEIYLAKYEGVTDFPWEFTESCEGGGSHRLDIATDIKFTATAPSGMVYRWYHEIEPRSANGSGSYQIDVAGIKAIYAKLPEAALASLKKYLADCAVKVRARADEQNVYITAQYGTAAELERLSK